MLGMGRINRFLQDRRVRRIHRDHRINHQKEYQRIDEILIKFQTAGGLKHDYQAYKLFSLWEILLTERPRQILEFGTGSSTAMFADYVRTYGGRLHCIDESQKWLENSMDLAGIESSDSRFIMQQAERCVVYRDGEPVEFGYDISTEESAFDLVLIDGPSMRINGGRYKQAVNSDVFKVIESEPPVLILVDIRAATVEAMTKCLTDQYSCQTSDIILKKIYQGYRYFSEFRRIS